MGFVDEFMVFLKKHQVIGLAIAFIMGGAAAKLVSSLVADIIMPIIGVLIPGGDWRKITLDIGPVKLLVGDFAGALIDFVIIAFVIFASQERSLINSCTSAVQKNLIPLVGGLPRGCRRPAARTAAMAWGGQFNSPATCSTVRRAGNWPLNNKNRCCFSSMVRRRPSRLLAEQVGRERGI